MEDTEIRCSKSSFLDPNFGIVLGFPLKPVSSDFALLTTTDKSIALGCILGAP